MTVHRPRFPRSTTGAALLLATTLLFACTDAKADDDVASASSPVGSPTTTGAAAPTDTTEQQATDADATPSTTTVPEAPSATWTAFGEPGVGGRITEVLFHGERILAGGDMLGISYTDDEGATWQPTTGLASWEIASITPHPTRPNELWAGTMSGPHVSLDNGETWELRREGMPFPSKKTYTSAIEVVLFDPTDDNRLLAFGGSQREWFSPEDPLFGHVWESTDAGATWAKHSVVSPGANLSAAVFIDDSTVVVSTLGGGIFRSEDGGSTWSSSDEGLRHGFVSDLIVHPADPTRLWAALRVTEDRRGGGVYTSEDGGLTWAWTDQDIFPDGGPIRNLASFDDLGIGSQAPYPLFASNRADDDQAVYRSLDLGETWERVLNKSSRLTTAYASGPSAEAFGVDPEDASRVLLAQSEYILLSENTGQTWNDITSVTDDGQTFRGTGFSGLVSTDAAVNPFDTDQILLTGFDGANLLASTDGGVSWTRPLTEWDFWTGASDVSISGPRAQRIDVVMGQTTFNGLATSLDGGETWTFREGEERGLPARGTVLSPGVVVPDPDGVDRLWLTLGDDVLVSTDGGSSWRLQPAITQAHALVAVGADTLYAGTDDGLLRSIDGGASYEQVEGTPPNVIGVHPVGGTSPDVFVLSNDETQGGLWIWDDRTTWKHLFEDPAVSDFLFDPADRKRMVVTTDDDPFHDLSNATGVWASIDDGFTWHAASDGLAMLRVHSIDLLPTAEPRLIAGTTGRGFFDVSLEALFDAVAVGDNGADDSAESTEDNNITDQTRDS